jgi:predicted transcriptional regulator
MTPTPAEMARLARVFNGFSQRTRLALLLGFYDDQRASEVAEFLDISRAGMQNHLKKMREAELIRKQDGGYELTALGIFFAEWLIEQNDTILQALDTLDDAEKEFADQLGADLEESDRKRIHGLKWSLAREDIEELLKREDEN